jgi:hypothetical protein
MHTLVPCIADEQPSVDMHSRSPKAHMVTECAHIAVMGSQYAPTVSCKVLDVDGVCCSDGCLWREAESIMLKASFWLLCLRCRAPSAPCAVSVEHSVLASQIWGLSLSKLSTMPGEGTLVCFSRLGSSVRRRCASTLGTVYRFPGPSYVLPTPAGLCSGSEGLPPARGS